MDKSFKKNETRLHNSKTLNKRNIVIISSEFPPGPGGIGHHAFSLAKALVGEGFAVKALSAADYATQDEVLDFDRSQSFEIHRYPRFGGWYGYFVRLWMTFKHLPKSDIKMAILTGKFSLWQGLLIKIFFPKIRTLAILHGSEINLASRFLRWITHRSIFSADILVPVSHFTKSLLPQWILQRHRFIQVVPNGIDTTFQGKWKESNSLSLEGYPRLLTVGHVSPRKGQHRVIKALPKLISVLPDLHYHMVGRPIDQYILMDLARRLGVEHHITFHGRVPEHSNLLAYYSQADVFMLLSENQADGDVEGFGIVALEANQLGVPVVGSKYCGVEEAVYHMHSGYLVDGGSSDEILEGVEFCLANREKLQEGMASWVDQHQWVTIVKQYKKLLS